MKNNKKRIFIANDASYLASGYGVYGKELLSRLHNSGKYEVAELGCYATIKSPEIKKIPWKFYPNAVNADDKRFEQYKNNHANQFGAWRFNRCLIDFRPDIVADLRDYWMYSYQETSPLKKHFNWVIMPTVDSAPQRPEWLYTFANADIVVPYTDWAKRVLSESCGSNINLFPKIANAGINPDEFYPIENKAQHKAKYFGNDKNIIGVVMRNQKRKLFADLFEVFRKYLDKLKSESKIDIYNKSILYLHTSYPEDNGWDFPTLLLEYNIIDKVYFSYVCRNCKHFFPSKFQNSIVNCPNCKENSAAFCSVSNPASTKQLNTIYNFFDIFLQYAICEGFGMPQVEAASCGVPIASVDYSAMTEVADKLGGIKIPVKKLFREMETNANRAYPDNDFVVDLLYKYFVNTDQNFKNKWGAETRQKCCDIYTWDNVYKVWEEVFDSIDTNNKLSWGSPVSPTNHQSIKVPPNLNPRDFIEYICYTVINEPSLMNTAFVQTLIKDMQARLISRNGMTHTIDYNQAVKMLEGVLNNKIALETMRTNPHLQTTEDYLKCQQ